MRFIKVIDIKSAMKIPINMPILGKEELNEVTSILRGGALTSAANTGGKYVQEFEKLASSFVKAKYAVAVNSGTAALQAALLSLNVKAGDEVLLPSFTFVATANAVISVGAKPIFIDILKENYTMDPNDLEKKIIKKLNSKGIGAAAYYPTPIHKTPFYNKKIKLPVTDWAASQVLSLPIHPLVSTKDIEFIAKTFRESL